jgi:hypothetical protein
LIAKEINEGLRFGLSLLTGPMIDQPIAAARQVKRSRPDLPVIFGGWHPSLLPAQTLGEQYVDAVVLNRTRCARSCRGWPPPTGWTWCVVKRLSS